MNRGSIQGSFSLVTDVSPFVIEVTCAKLVTAMPSSKLESQACVKRTSTIPVSCSSCVSCVLLCIPSVCLPQTLSLSTTAWVAKWIGVRLESRRPGAGVTYRIFRNRTNGNHSDLSWPWRQDFWEPFRLILTLVAGYLGTTRIFRN